MTRRAERNDYHLAALDMDGTLLNSAHVTTPYTRAVLRRAAEAGRVAALCTGRCLSELREHLAAIPDIRYVIAESGACLYDAWEKRALRQLSFPAEVSQRVLAASAGYELCVQMFIDNQSYMEIRPGTSFERCHIGDFASAFEEGSLFMEDAAAFLRAHGGVAEKINLYFADAGALEAFLPAIADLGLQLTASIGVGVEISPREATKANGLRALCDHLGIPIADAMAVGDGGNDLDVLAAAGLAVAMGNAIDAVRALADAVTEDCDHDGAAKAMEKYMGL